MTTPRPDRRAILTGIVVAPILAAASGVVALPAPSGLPGEWATLAEQISNYLPEEREPEVRAAVLRAYSTGLDLDTFAGFAWNGPPRFMPVSLYFGNWAAGEVCTLVRATHVSRYIGQGGPTPPPRG